MRFTVNLSLQRKMVLLVLAVLAVSVGLFSWLGIQSLNESTARTLEERLTTARYVASHMDETLTYVLVQLQNTVDSFEGLPGEEEFGPVALSLRDILTKSGIVTQYVVLLDEDGTVIRARPEDPGIVGTILSGHDEVARALDTGQVTISGLVSTTDIEEPAVLATVPVLDAEGRIVGALSSIIDINRSSIGALHEPVFYGETVYAEIVDANGIVIARTEPGRAPELFEQSDHPGRFAALISEGKATVRTCHRCHGPEGQPKRRRDILAFAPLSTASWGVAIRQAEEEALAPTRQLQERLIIGGAVVLVGTLFLMWLVMQGIMKPIKILTTASRKVAAGDFSAVIPIRRGDEIGQLGSAFSTMTRELARSRDELVSRTQDLSALNSVSTTVSQSLNLEEVVANALRKVLEVARAEAGCVFLLGPGGSLEMKCRIDPSDLFGCHEAISPATECACHQALHWEQAQLVNDVSQCPRMSDNLAITEGIGCFVCIPLRSTRRVLGVMNVAFSSERCLAESDLKLLDSIGYHVGLAFDNSILYEEAREEEALRRRLLDSAISAQEEERKRIARELHDEYGQILTGLIWSIESIENVTSPEQEQVKDKLTSAKSLASHALEVTRRLSLDLRPPALDDLGLIAAIRAYAQTHLEAVGVQLSLEIEGSSRRLASSVEIILFRIVQEAVHNVAKHAEAQSVRIRLEFRDSNRIVVVVEDDGRGFDVDVVLRSGSKAQSLGLLGIRERAALLNGSFDIRSVAREGTRLTVEIPVDGSLQGESSGDRLAHDGELQ